MLKVLSGPPGPVIFTWRHWANFNGKFQENQGQGDLIELYGLSRVIVNEDLKIQKVEVSNKQSSKNYPKMFSYFSLNIKYGILQIIGVP